VGQMCRVVSLLGGHQAMHAFLRTSSLTQRVSFCDPHSGSKYALEALSDCLRLELAPWRVSVSLLQPGFIQVPHHGSTLYTYTHLQKISHKLLISETQQPPLTCLPFDAQIIVLHFRPWAPKVPLSLRLCRLLL
jgi:NAD(P)-dependent dehydrogenase (short-subunit alcohol dehydrogenase family)